MKGLQKLEMKLIKNKSLDPKGGELWLNGAKPFEKMVEA